MKVSTSILRNGICFLLVSSVVPIISQGQATEKEILNHAQTWFSINSVVRLSDKFGLVADAHTRRTNFIADPNFYFARIGTSYWIKENLVSTVGYAHMWVGPSKQDWHHFAEEHRIYQQIQLNFKFNKVGMVQRLRNEQRWQEEIVDDHFDNKYKFTDRIRYLLSISIPLSSNPHYPSLVEADELMIQFGKEIVYNTFDQNRIFIGFKQPVCKSLSFDLGYMLVHQQRASGYQYDNNHTLRLFFYYNPDLRKK